MLRGDPAVVGPPIDGFRFKIKCGSAWRWNAPQQFLDADTGRPAAFLEDLAGTWIARMDIRTTDGTLLARLRSDDLTADGTLTFDNNGGVSASLSSTFTRTMPTTRTYQNPGLGWANTSEVVAELELVNPADGEPVCWFTGTGTIEQEVTTSL